MKIIFNHEEFIEPIELDMSVSDRLVDKNNDQLLQAIKDKVDSSEYNAITTIVDNIQREIMDLITNGGIVSTKNGKIVLFSIEEREFILKNFKPYRTNLGSIESWLQLSIFEGKDELLKKLEIFNSESVRYGMHPLKVIQGGVQLKLREGSLKQALAKRFNEELAKLGFSFYFKSKSDTNIKIFIGVALVRGAVNSVHFEG